MKRKYWNSCVAMVLLVSILSRQTIACTILTLVTGGQVYFGNNEDFNKRGAVWIVPASDGRLGRINFGFHDWLGFREDFAQGSMNERGLAFDAAVAAEVDWQPDPNKPTPKNLIEVIMNTCETVEQAIAMFRENNCHHLSGGQFMFADATGDSTVIAWLPDCGLSIERRTEKHQVVTNTRLSASGYRCQRWTRATQILATDPHPSLDTVRQALEAVHQYGAGFTSYSCIYDLKQQQVHIYNLTNFNEVVVLDLHEKLRDGASSFLLKDLFQESPALREVQAKPQRDDYHTRIQLSPEELKRFEGTYVTETDPALSVRVAATSKGLKVLNEGRPDAELFPESSHIFRLAPDRGQVSFQITDDGRVTGLTLHKQIDVVAKRQ